MRVFFLGTCFFLPSFSHTDKLFKILRELPEVGVSQAVLLETLDRSKERVASNDGRRRTVIDSDCDSLKDKEDLIEGSCASYRYEVLQELTPRIKFSMTEQAFLMANITTLNTTYHGSETDASFSTSIDKVLGDQRDMLYGVGGNCLNPKPGSLASGSDVLSRALSEVADELAAALDTNWRNMVRIDSNVTEAYANGTMIFSRGTQEMLNEMNDAQSSLFVSQGQETNVAVASLNRNLVNISARVNALQGNISYYLSDASKTDSGFRNETDPPLSDLLDLVDQLADEFVGVDDIFTNSIKTLSAQLSPILSPQPGKAASDPVKAISDKNAQYISSYSDASTADISNSWADWNNTFESILNMSEIESEQYASRIDDAQGGINGQLSDASSTIDRAVNKTQNQFKTAIRDLLKTGKDARNVVWATVSKLRNTKGSLESMYSSLAGVSGEAADHLRKQIAALLSSGGEASANQLRVVLQQFGAIQNQLGSADSETNAKLASAVANIRSLVGNAGLGQSTTGSDAQKAVASNREYTQSLTGLADASMQSVIGSTSAGLLGAADKNGAAIAEASMSFSNSISGSKNDANSAISSGSDSLGAASSASHLASAQSNYASITALSGNSSLLEANSHTAGDSLNGINSQLSNSISSAHAARNNLDHASSQSSDGAATLANNLGGLDSNTADQFGQQSSIAFASAAKDSDSAAASAAAYSNAQASKVAGEVSGMQAQSDAAETAMWQNLAQAESFDEDSVENIQTLASSFYAAVGSVQDGSGKIQGSFTQTLGTASTKEMGPVTWLSSDVAKAASEAQSQGSAQTDKAVNGQVNSFKSRVAAIAAQVRSGKSNLDPKVVRNLISLSNGHDRVRSAIDAGRDQLNGIEAQVAAGGKMQDDTLNSIQALLNSMLHGIEKNFTNLTSVVNASLSDMPSQFPDGIDGAIRKIIADVIAANNQFQTASWGMTRSAANESNSSVSVVNELENTTESFQSNLNSAQSLAAQKSASRVDLLSSIADSAGGVASLVSAFERRATGANTVGSNGVSRAGMTLQGMISGLQSALSATNGSLSSSSSTSQAQSLFNGRLSQSQASRLLQGLQAQTETLHLTSNDAEDALSEATGTGAMNLAGMERTLRENDADRKIRLAKAMQQLGGINNDLAKNVTGNKDAVTIQLMMAKRAVRDILSAWYSYTDYETKKFKKMKSTDKEYLSMSAQRVDYQSAESRSNLTSSQASLSLMAADIQAAIEDYLSFQNSTESQVDLLRSVIPALNSSAQATIAQLGESMKSLDDQDVASDMEARSSSLSEILNFEASLDQNAQMVVAAASGDLLPAISR